MLNAVEEPMHEEEKPPQPEQPAPAVDPLVGKVLAGRFRLDALIARGGMGKIYRATQQPLERQVALKVLDVMDEGDGEFRKRFFMEASLCSKLSHPNTVRIFDYGCSDDGVYFIAMEFLEGHTLSQLIRDQAPIEPLRAIQIIKQICGALAEAHERGIIHRDMKPANVFVTYHEDLDGSDDFAKVVDFGLVKDMNLDSELSKTGHVLGSPMYMSPEQVHNDNVDQRTDIYAVGMILYTMLIGQTPFKRGNMLAVLMAQIHKPVPAMKDLNPDVDVQASLEWVALTALSKPREDRFASMREFLKAIKACEKELRGEVREPIVMRMDDGLVVLPEGMEVSEEIKLSDAVTRKLSSVVLDSAAATLNVPNPVGKPLGALRALTLLAVAAGLMLIVAVAGGVGAVMTGRLGQPPPVVVEPAPIAPPAPIETKEVVRQPVHVTSLPSGAELERDGIYMGSTPITLQVPEGDEWIVTLKAPEHEARTVRLAAGQTELEVRLTAMKKVAPKPAVPVPSPQPSTQEPKPSTDLRNPWGE
jgi:serine/threonine protein kinase